MKTLFILIQGIAYFLGTIIIAFISIKFSNKQREKHSFLKKADGKKLKYFFIALIMFILGFVVIPVLEEVCCPINPLELYLDPGGNIVTKTNLTGFDLELKDSSKKLEDKSRNYFKVGVQDLDSNNIKDALNNFQKSLDVLPTASAYLNLSNCLIITSSYKEAKTAIESGMRLDFCKRNKKYEAIFIYLMGLVNFECGELSEALQNFTSSLKISKEEKFPYGIMLSYSGFGIVQLALGNIYMSDDSLDMALQLSRDLKNKSIESSILNSIGDNFYEKSKFEEAIEYYNSSLGISEDNSQNQAVSLMNLSRIQYKLGKIDIAQKGLKKALSIAESFDDLSLKATILNDIGSIYKLIGNTEEAFLHFNNSLSLKERIGSRLGTIAPLLNIGTIYLNRGDYKDAFDNFNKSLKISKEEGYIRGQIDSKDKIAWAYLEINEIDKSMQYFNESLAMSKKIGNPVSISHSLLGICEILIKKGETEEASQYAQKALDIYKNIDFEYYLANAYFSLGEIYLKDKKLDDALIYFEDALELNKKLNSSFGQASILGYIGTIHLEKGELDKAIESYTKSNDIYIETGMKVLEAINFCNIGIAYAKKKDSLKALEFFQKGLKIYEQKNNIQGIIKAKRDIGTTYMILGNKALGSKYLKESRDLEIKNSSHK